MKYAPQNDAASGSDKKQDTKVDTSSDHVESQNKEANTSQVEQKDDAKPNEENVSANGTGDSKVADKETAKNELALAYANRLVFYCSLFCVHMMANV